MIKAVIFDMDGLMVEANSTYVNAETRLVNEYGKEYSHEIRKKYIGKRISAMLEVIIKEYELPITLAEGEEKLRKYVKENFKKQSVALLPGCEQLIKSLSKSGKYLMAVASSSPKEMIEIVVKRFGFKDDFSVIVSSEEVENGKPAPDIFLKCAELLKISPNKCVVLEDAPLGIQAAKQAGMMSIAVYIKEINNPEDFLDMPDKIVSSLKDVNIEMIENL